MSERLVPTGEAARQLGISARSLSRWVQEGLITPALKTAGGQSRFVVDDLRKQLVAMNTRPVEQAKEQVEEHAEEDAD